jgi:hypothetical protein
MNLIVKNNFNGWFILFLLLFLGWDFHGIGHYITFILLPYIIITSILKRFVDKESLWLLFFSAFYVAILFSYSLVWQKFGIGKMFSYLFLPFTAYLSGKYLIKKNHHDQQLFLFLLFFALAIMIMPLTSVLHDIYVNGFVGGSRNMVLLNGVDIERSATGIDSYLVVMASLSGLLMWRSGNKMARYYKWLFVVLSFVSIICILRIGSRTGMFVVAMSLFIVLAYNFRKHRIVFYLLLFASLVLFIANIVSSSNPLLSYMAERANENNLDTMGGRLPLWNYYFSHLWSYPWGNIPSKFSYTPFAHNFWLDVARLTGIYPVILLLVFNLLALKIFFRFINNKNLSPLYKNVVLVWHLAIYSVFFVEPVIEGLFSLFVFYCFLVGMMQQSNAISKHRKRITTEKSKINRGESDYITHTPKQTQL